MNRLYIAIGILLCLVSTGVSVAMVWALSTFFAQLSDVGVVLTMAAFVVGSGVALLAIKRAV